MKIQTRVTGIVNTWYDSNNNVTSSILASVYTMGGNHFLGSILICVYFPMGGTHFHGCEEVGRLGG